MSDLNKLIEWYEKLDRESLHCIDDLYDSQCFFKDPFNEIRGVEKIKKIFIHMFTNLENPHFIFLDIITNETSSFLTWDFIFFIKNKEYKIHGSTHLKWLNGKVIYHRDYWDVGEELLLKIPLIRSIYGYFAKKLASD
jgi:hypothetical protein